MSFLDNYRNELAQEKKRLEHIVTLLQKQLDTAELKRESKEALILAAKEEMPDDTTHAMTHLSSANSFEDLVELSQYAYMVAGHVAEHESEAQKIRRFRSMIIKPYFSRIDFVFGDTQEKEPIYIGRYSLRDEASRAIVVYDWRSPIASVFYRFATGEAFYEAPGGTIAGEVVLKRQFEILKSKLEFFFDANIEIVDAFLRQLLSQNAPPQMKTIVETIQKDQDIVIRDQEHDLVMVQGAAGSGKTSIALHRAAYLMYQGIAGAGLSSGQILILSPNRLFERYISHVLPELGEQSVQTMVFEEVFEKRLQREMNLTLEVQSKNQLLEQLLTDTKPTSQEGLSGLADSIDLANPPDLAKKIDPAEQAAAKSALAFKMSEQFVEILNRYIYEIPRCRIPFAAAEYGGRLVMSRDMIQAKVLQQEKRLPLGVRLKKTRMLIRQNVHKMRAERLQELRNYVQVSGRHPFDGKEYVRMLSIRESMAMIRRVQAYTEIDVLALYAELFQDEETFYRLAQGLSLPPDIGTILDDTRKNLCFTSEAESSDEQAVASNHVLLYGDAAALTYLQLIISGCHDFTGIQQVVVDEAQDYYPLHYAILRVLFPKARYTVLGDIHQSMEKEADITIYENITKILGKKNPALLTLATSFRSTREIIDFSAGFLGKNAQIKSFSRSGEPPALYGAADGDALLDRMVEEIKRCLDSKYQSVGLICKTEGDAVEIYQSLKQRVNLRLIRTDGVEELTGVSVMPIYMAKGLEFDAVLMCRVDKDHYASEDDRRLLYIACTRALHRLSLFYEGEISPLVTQSLGEGGHDERR